MANAKEILAFWFGHGTDPWTADPGKAQLWFARSDQTDLEIARLFGDDVRQAGQGELDAWAVTPHGRLGLLILLDQFTRNLHRDSPHAFDHDDRARALALQGIELEQDRAVRPVERAFFYLPLMHSEDLALQETSVVLYQTLLDAAPPEHAQGARQSLRYAVRHRDIIAKFGRFPHRNAVLARPSTPEELAFLQTPGSSF
jgi:uncharacterized protein (DUF924 family)